MADPQNPTKFTITPGAAVPNAPVTGYKVLWGPAPGDIAPNPMPNSVVVPTADLTPDPTTGKITVPLTDILKPLPPPGTYAADCMADSATTYGTTESSPSGPVDAAEPESAGFRCRLVCILCRLISCQSCKWCKTCQCRR